MIDLTDHEQQEIEQLAEFIDTDDQCIFVASPQFLAEAIVRWYAKRKRHIGTPYELTEDDELDYLYKRPAIEPERSIREIYRDVTARYRVEDSVATPKEA